MRFVATVLSAIGTLALAGPACAGAWTQDKGSGLVILSGDYYATGQYFDNKGHKQSQPDYNQYALNPYAEYGLWDGFTVGANLSLQRAHQDGGANSLGQTNFGLGDSEFFVRQRLWQRGGLVVSAEPMVKLPSPESSPAEPRLGGSSPDAGLGLSAGYGFAALGRNHFVDLDTQYRHRFGSPTDQVNLAGTLGIGLSERFTLMPQAFLTYRTNAPAMAAFTDSPADDYNMVKLQLSGVYKLRDELSLQAGAFTVVDGKNTGSGSGVTLAVWRSF